MPGGLLNLVAFGNQNVLIHGNPTKTFFKSTYAKHTNFGIQKFRIDYEKQIELQLNTHSNLLFKVPRYADLLMDIYLVIDLPNIWSPILSPKFLPENGYRGWLPYEFKWIKNLGTNIIEEVNFTIGGHLIQKYTGTYLQNVVERDFDESKKKLFNIMTGNIDEINNPAKFYNGKYPNAFNFNPNSSTNNILPSIKGRRLYIPINIWFTLMSKMAFPLIALQYNELHIEFKLRPLNEMFVIRDLDHHNINDYTQTKYIKTNQNINYQQLHRFLQPPTQINLDGTPNDNYPNTLNGWRSNLHIIGNYCFLDNEEVRKFTSTPHQYLIKEMREYKYYELIGANQIKLDTNGLVANMMWYLQRSDIAFRNEWSNYTNWEYDHIIPSKPQRWKEFHNSDLTIEISNSTVPISPINSKKNILDIFHNDISYNRAYNNSIKNNTKLPCINNETDNNFYLNILKTHTNGHPYDCCGLWLGAINIKDISYYSPNDVSGAEFWSWSDKSKWIYNNFADDQPKTTKINSQDPLINNVHLYMDFSGKWNVSNIPTDGSFLAVYQYYEYSYNLYDNLNIGTLYDPSYIYNLNFTINKDTSLNLVLRNKKNILNEFAIKLDGKYRENLFDHGVYNFIDYYSRSSGEGKDCLYFYNFGLSTNPYSVQPNGAINLSQFNRVELEMNLIVPPMLHDVYVIEICDDTGNVIGIDKSNRNLHEYTFDLIVQEERYNLLTFTNGNAGLAFA